MSAEFNGLMAANELAQRLEGVDVGWHLDGLAGRFVEISGGLATASLTACAGLIAETQRRGGLAAWVGAAASTFFPPDFAASGIDLAALPVVRVTQGREAARAADTLLRSGAFALVVIDLGSKARLPLQVQTRLVGLAKKHHTALIAVTRKSRCDTAGQSLVSLRGETEKQRADHDCFVCELHVVKDKRRNPGWGHKEMCCGPDGLC